MAAKSILHHFGWRKGKYQVDKADFQIKSVISAKSQAMDGSYRKQGGEEPPAKKRRTEAELMGDELWDDSDFTQADLEDIEFQASQAYQHVKHEPSASTTSKPSHVQTLQPAPAVSKLQSQPPRQSVPVGHAQPSSSSFSMAARGGQQHDTSKTFLKPSLSRSSSSSGSNGSYHRPGHNTSNNSNSSVGHNTSNHSNSSSSHTSHSSYPDSISGYSSSKSSVSIKSGSSAEVGVVQSGSLTRGFSSDSFDISSLMQSNQSHMSEITKHKQEYSALQLQYDKLKDDNCEKEGAIQLLRENMKKKDAELDGLKTEKIQAIQQHNTQQSEKEKVLQTELSKLQTQLQFKDQEQRDLSSKVRELESQIKQKQAAASRPSTSEPFVLSQSLSPKPKRILVEERSPKAKRQQTEERSPKGHSGFPSKKTFMSVEGSPSKPTSTTLTLKETNVKITGSEVRVTPSGDNQSSMATISKCARLRQRRRVAGLQLAVGQQPASTRPHLVSRMIEMPANMSGNISERGIVALLNTPSTSAGVNSVQFDRDRDTSLLSPLKSQRMSDIDSLVKQADKPEMRSLVPIDHLNMAIYALKQLVDPSSHVLDPASRGTTSHNDIVQPGTSKSQTSPTTTLLPTEQNLDHAVLILPLIDDYLRHYVDMLETTLDTSSTMTTTSTSMSSSSDSFNTTTESPTGSVGMFLKTMANCANDLESLCIASLRVLHELVACPGVRNVLLLAQEGETVSVDDCQVTGSQAVVGPSKYNHIPLEYISKMNLLQKVMKLSNPRAKGQLFNKTVVIQCLMILTRLSTHAEPHHITSLMSILTEECLQNCIEQQYDPYILLHGLVLFKTLVKSKQIISAVCSNPTGCILGSIYNLFTHGKWNSLADSLFLHISNQTVESLLQVCSCHKGNVTVLLESDCQCSVEIVKSLICLLHSVMKIYKQHNVNHHKPPDMNSTSSSVSSSDKDSASSSSDKMHIPTDWFTDVGDYNLTEAEIITTSVKVLQTGLQLLHLLLQHDAGFSSRHVPVQHKYVQLVCALTLIFRRFENNDSEMNALQDLWDFNQDDSELSQDSDSDSNTSMDQT